MRIYHCKNHLYSIADLTSSSAPVGMTTDDPDIDVGGPGPDGCAEQTGYVEFRLPGDLLRCIVLTVQAKRAL